MEKKGKWYTHPITVIVITLIALELTIGLFGKNGWNPYVTKTV